MAMRTVFKLYKVSMIRMLAFTANEMCIALSNLQFYAVTKVLGRNGKKITITGEMVLVATKAKLREHIEDEQLI